MEELSTVHINLKAWPTAWIFISSRSKKTSIEVLTQQTFLAFILMYSSQMSFTSPPWTRHTDLYFWSRCGYKLFNSSTMHNTQCAITVNFVYRLRCGSVKHRALTQRHQRLSTVSQKNLICFMSLVLVVYSLFTAFTNQLFCISAGQTERTTQRVSFKPPATKPLCYLRHGVRLASPAWETHPGLLRVRGDCKSLLLLSTQMQKTICCKENIKRAYNSPWNKLSRVSIL